MGRIVPGGDGAVFFPDIVGVGINLLGITVFVMVFPIHPVRLGLARLIRRIRIDYIIVSGYEHPTRPLCLITPVYGSYYNLYL